MWALEATLSPNDRMFGYGAAMLTELARSVAASKEEKVLLDAVWEATGTQMRDSAIRTLLAEPRAVPEPDNKNPRSERTEGTGGGSGPLYREVLAARLKVVLDMELGRQTSPLVCELAEMRVGNAA